MSNTIPVGTIMLFPSQNGPNGWLRCDGMSFDPGLFPELAAALGTSVTPKIMDNFVIGASATRPARSAGGRSTPTVAHLKAHTHAVYSATDGQHLHGDGISSTNGEHQHDILMNTFPAWLGTSPNSAAYTVTDVNSTKTVTDNGIHNHGGRTDDADTEHTHEVATSGVDNPVLLPPFMSGVFMIKAIP